MVSHGDGHPGEKKLWMTLEERYYHPKLWYTIDRFKCSHCQMHKLSGRGYWLLPECEVRVATWEEVAIDLIGTWTVKVIGCKVEFNALTCIDTASNLAALVHIDNKISLHICNKCGSQDIHNQSDVPTTKVANLLVKHSNGCFKYLVLKTYSLQVKTHNQTWSVNECTKRLPMFCVH
jgi:hypothetical protein